MKTETYLDTRYQTKASTGHGEWLAKHMAKDIGGCGCKDVKIQIKCDQEPSVVAVQTEIQRMRHGRTICVNSPVGESECNGRVGNAMLDSAH